MNYQVTGNEYVSLPTIRESDGAIEGISCLFMRLKGMLEMKGQGRFIQPYIELYGKQIAVSPVWSVSISGFRPLNPLQMTFLFVVHIWRRLENVASAYGSPF